MKRDALAHKRDIVPQPVAFTPKGGCPLKLRMTMVQVPKLSPVAFTPKGGCPLKRVRNTIPLAVNAVVAFTPKGGCPLKLCERGEFSRRWFL